MGSPFEGTPFHSANFRTLIGKRVPNRKWAFSARMLGIWWVGLLSEVIIFIKFTFLNEIACVSIVIMKNLINLFWKITFRHQIIFLISRVPCEFLRYFDNIAHTYSSDTQETYMSGNLDVEAICGRWSPRKSHRADFWTSRYWEELFFRKNVCFSIAFSHEEAKHVFVNTRFGPARRIRPHSCRNCP